MRLFSATIISNTEIRTGLNLLQVHSPYLVQAAQPGQYVMVAARDTLATDPLLRRPFFVHATRRDHQLCSFLVAAQGLYRRYERLRHKHVAQCLVTRPFACASGVCLACAIDTHGGARLVCRDGPVFALEEVVSL